MLPALKLAAELVALGGTGSRDLEVRCDTGHSNSARITLLPMGVGRFTDPRM